MNLLTMSWHSSIKGYGRLWPGCVYNMFYRYKDPRFTGPKGRTEVSGKTVRPAASGTRILPPVAPSST